MKWFLEHGADLNLNADGESSPLDLAASSGAPFTVSQLLECGAKLDDSNALQFATSRLIVIPMVGFILDCGFGTNYDKASSWYMKYQMMYSVSSLRLDKSTRIDTTVSGFHGGIEEPKRYVRPEAAPRSAKS